MIVARLGAAEVRRIALLLGAASLALLPSRLAHAGQLFEVSGDQLGMGGLTNASPAPQPLLLIFNPALLPFADPGVELGLFFLNDRISIDVDARSPAADIPENVNRYGNPDGSPRLSLVPLPTKWLNEGIHEESISRSPRPRQGEYSDNNTSTYSVIGLVSRVYSDRVAMGLYAAIPLGGFTEASSFYNDEREQFFSNSLYPELYAGRLDEAELAFGLGGRVLERLSLGVSFTLSLKNNAVTPVYVSDAARLGNVLIDADIKVNTAVSPHFGVVFDASRRLRLTATLHTVQSMEVKTDFSYTLNSGTEQGSNLVFTYGYYPWSVALGASFILIEPPEGSPQSHKLSLVGTALLSYWNEYRDRHNERAVQDYAWSNVVTPSLGVRYSYASWNSFFDLTYAPSPAPKQTGRTNYVDNDRMGMNGGLEYAFALIGAPLRAGAQVQLHRLLPRHQNKLNPLSRENQGKNPNSLVIDEVPDNAIDIGADGAPAKGSAGLQTNNPGWPGFGSEGWLLGGGVYMALLF